MRIYNVDAVVDEVNKFMDTLTDTDMVYSHVTGYCVVPIDSMDVDDRYNYGGDDEYVSGKYNHVMLTVIKIDNTYTGQILPISVDSDNVATITVSGGADEIYGGGPDYGDGTESELREWMDMYIDTVGAEIVWL